jgi:hypothetical protein
MISKSMSGEELAAIDGGHFYCGIVLMDGKVIETPPIVAYMRGWTREKVASYCRRKGWKLGERT